MKIIIDHNQLLIMKGEVCPYCNGKSKFVDSQIVYGKSFGMIYLCSNCRAWVGVHKGTTTALGRLANAELRLAKKEAHKYFDMLWKLKLITRPEAYKYLSEWLQIHPDFTHIGMFGVKTCKSVVEFSKQKLNDNRRLDLDIGAIPITPYFEP